MPFTSLGVRDGLDIWVFRLGNDLVGVLDDTAVPNTVFARSANVDTRSDYHEYAIQFNRNGLGTADDTADFFYDGSLLFANVSRAEIGDSALRGVEWGPGATD